MFKRVFLTYMMVVMAAAGTGTMTRLAESAPAVQTTGSRQLPAAPAIPTQGSVPVSSPMSASQMSAATGQGVWGWLKKIWKKHKKKILKIIWQIIQEIIETVISQTSEYVEGVNGEVVENYEGTEQTDVVYNSQTDYDNNNVASTSYSDGGYGHTGTDYSGGSYDRPRYELDQAVMN
ncbi:MAG TPA: hypothetical protein VK358_18890 [Longimicrobium sp.]|nr:hypothetical protein [Longimicrobium sp.]